MTGQDRFDDHQRSFGPVRTITKDRLRPGIGLSEATDAADAGRCAATAALAALDGEQAALVLVYASVRYHLPTLLGAIRSVTGDTPLVGASSSGHLHNGQVTRAGRGVAVLALTSGPYRFGVGAVTGIRNGSFAAGQSVARAARAAAAECAPQPHAALLVLADGLAGHHEALLAGAHKVAGAAVPVVGGAAGDDKRLTETYVFIGDRVLTDAAVGVWIASPWPLNVEAAHGWQPTSLPMLVTKVDGNVVHEIGGRPATELFGGCLDEHHPRTGDDAHCRCPCCTYAALRQRDHRSATPVGTTAPDHRAGYHASHALGLIQPDGSQLVRGGYVDDDGRLNTFCPVPLYSAVQVVSARPDDLLAVADEIVPKALYAQRSPHRYRHGEGDGPRSVGSDRDAGVLLLFSCVARWDLLGERGPEEAVRLQAAAGNVATFGFYTYGEFARNSSVSGYHNATLTAVAL